MESAPTKTPFYSVSWSEAKWSTPVPVAAAHHSFEQFSSQSEHEYFKCLFLIILITCMATVDMVGENHFQEQKCYNMAYNIHSIDTHPPNE